MYNYKKKMYIKYLILFADAKQLFLFTFLHIYIVRYIYIFLALKGGGGGARLRQVCGHRKKKKNKVC